MCRKEYVWYPRSFQGKWHSKRFCSNECATEHMKSELSKITKARCERNEFGGKNNDTYKKHIRGWYKGIFCGSSWELAFVIFSLDKGKNIKRCDKKLPYTYNGQIYNYYPDFEIDDTIYEIKGFEDYKAKAKQQTYPEIKVMRRKEMTPILEYVKRQYGKDFSRLFETIKRD